jgi:hypothetical protein
VHRVVHGDRFTVDAHRDRRWVGADDDLGPGICQRFDRALAAFRGIPDPLRRLDEVCAIPGGAGDLEAAR